MYLTILKTQQWSRIADSDAITGVMRDKDHGAVAARQSGDSLCKHNLFIAALDYVAAFFCLLHDSKFDICRSRE
jgi:hypothetical protein